MTTAKEFILKKGYSGIANHTEICKWMEEYHELRLEEGQEWLTHDKINFRTGVRYLVKDGLGRISTGTYKVKRSPINVMPIFGIVRDGQTIMESTHKFSYKYLDKIE